jgi:UDPglucose 6-dehydrogenase
MKIAIIGSGYVGLVAGACFADSGVVVICVDSDEKKLAKLEKGEVPFYEPGLSDIIKRNWPYPLNFSSDLVKSVQDCEVVFLAVGTPPNEDGSADLSHVLQAALQVAQAATHDLILVLKSTVPVGTNELVTNFIQTHSKYKISVVSNPEFLKEGDAVHDFFEPDRIVVGTEDDHAFEVLARLYAPFNRRNNRIQRMSPKSAEVVKYASNAFLAVKISFMNEIAGLCDKVDADVESVRIAVGSDERIGMKFLYPGLGFGGSCFPKDLRALSHIGSSMGANMGIVDAAIRANTIPVISLIQQMKRDVGISGKKIAVWGIAFKPKTDDVREAQSIRLMEMLVKEGATIRATDPQALSTGADKLADLGIFKEIAFFDSEYDACKGADILVIATEWNHYRNPDFNKIRELMHGNHIFDGRNCLNPQDAVKAGFIYRGIGRPQRKPE